MTCKMWKTLLASLLIVQSFFGNTNLLELTANSCQKLKFVTHEFPPFVIRSNSKISGTLFDLAVSMTEGCCNETFPIATISVPNMWYLTKNLESYSDAHIFVPATAPANGMQTAPGRTFLPVLETPGPYLLYDSKGKSGAPLATIMAAWPLFLLIITSAGLAGIFIWILEQNFNPEEFPPSFFKGFEEGLWWSFVSMTTVGYGDRTPKSLPGRIFGLLWIMGGIIISAMFIAVVTTAFQSDAISLVDMNGKKTGVLNGSEEFTIAIMHSSRPVVSDNLTELFDGLLNAQFDSILVDSYRILGLGHELSKRGIVAGFQLPRVSYHGILLQNIEKELLNCFKSVVGMHRFSVYADIVDEVATFSETYSVTYNTMRITKAFETAVIYMCALFIALFLGFSVRECIQVYNRRKKKDKDIRNGDIKSNSIFDAKQDALEMGEKDCDLVTVTRM